MTTRPPDDLPAHPHLSTRVAPPGLTLPVPLHVKVTSLGLGAGSALLGLLYLMDPPTRTGPLSNSTMALMEVPLGIAMLALGAWVATAALTGHARASAHGVAAVAHLAYCVALVLTWLALEPPKPSVASVLSLFAFVAHGGASIDYWKRGWR